MIKYRYFDTLQNKRADGLTELLLDALVLCSEKKKLGQFQKLLNKLHALQNCYP